MVARKKSKWADRREAAKCVPLTAARGQLTEIVDAADWLGKSTVLTRNGKPVAMVVPFPVSVEFTSNQALLAKRLGRGRDGR